MRKRLQTIRERMGIPSGRIILAFIAFQALGQFLWWAVGKVFSTIPDVVKGWGFLAVFIATIFAVTWYLSKLSRQNKAATASGEKQPTVSWLDQELSSDLERVYQGIRGRFTKWDFSNVYNREPYFEIFNELTNTTLFTFSLKGITGLMKIEGQQCVNPSQISMYHGITRDKPVTIRLTQSISPETAKLIQNCGSKNQEMPFDLRNMEFEFANTTKGYEQHKPRLTGGDYRIVPKDGLKVDNDLAPTSLKADKITAFYSTRESLNQLYGGIEQELAKADIVYAAWHGATEAVCKSEQLRRKVERLLLVNPEATAILSVYADTGSNRGQISEVQSDILKATEAFRLLGTKVRWFRGPFNLLTILDPDDTTKARARVEVWVFEETNKRQNYIIYKRENEVAYKHIIDTFEKMWNDTQWAHEPPNDLNNVRKRLGLSIQDSSPKSI